MRSYDTMEASKDFPRSQNLTLCTLESGVWSLELWSLEYWYWSPTVLAYYAYVRYSCVT